MDFSWRIGGEAGYGIVTAGLMFSKMCMRHGLYVYGTREYPSLIRGGYNNFNVRFGDRKILSQLRKCDMILALNERTVAEEKKFLSKDGIIICDESVKVNARAVRVHLNDKNRLMRNTFLVGVSAGMLGFNRKKCESVIKERFKKKGQKIVDENLRIFNDGFSIGMKNKIMDVPVRSPLKEMLVNGNTAFAMGAIRAGCNFISAYPMTPATGILEYICSKAGEYGIRAVQPEDEISSLNMALGASFAGARSMTCTSGGGFALMNEALSLGGMTEAPVVIAVSQRPAPATGLPTRTAQGDLNFVLNAGHGEFSKIVIAPGDVNECYEDALNAFNYADRYQTPVIVLLDKHLSVSIDTAGLFKDNYRIDRGLLVRKAKPVLEGHRFKRYEYTKSGISPRPVPGIKGITYAFAGDEHDEEGFIIEDAEKAVKINDKRLRKEKLIRKELSKGIKVYGNGDITLVGWGSTKNSILQAQEILKKEGIKTRFIQVRILRPLPLKEIRKQIRGKPIVIENNRDGQLAGLLGTDCHRINKYDGRPLHPEEIAESVRRMVK